MSIEELDAKVNEAVSAFIHSVNAASAVMDSAIEALEAQGKALPEHLVMAVLTKAHKRIETEVKP